MQGLEVGPAEEVPCDPYEERKNTLKRHESGEHLPRPGHSSPALRARQPAQACTHHQASLSQIKLCKLLRHGSLLMCCRPAKPPLAMLLCCASDSLHLQCLP